MRSLERGRNYEQLAQSISRIAYAYGFTSAPTLLSRKTVAATASDTKTAAAVALLSLKNNGNGSQVWGSTKTNKGTVIAFAITSPRQAVAEALVVKTALSVAETASYTNLSVLISSVGDAESRRRFSRELGNFFRKHTDALDAEMKNLAGKDPEAAYRALVSRNDPLLARAPRSIDYLSENSRKTMLATLSLFESVGIPYAIDARLPSESNVHSELLFAIEGTDGKHGERVRLATGGHYDDALKREHAKGDAAVGISIEVPERIECEATESAPHCFVVHVGDAAKLKAFGVVEALWRAQVAVGQALMAESLREQVLAGQNAHAKYLAIIGQREALDGTVIVRNAGTQIQSVMPLEKLGSYVGRSRG